MTEILVKATVRTPAIDWKGVPSNLKYNYDGRVSAVCRSMQECEDLVRWFGNGNFCPALPILLTIPGHPQVIQTDGYVPVSEFRDLAVYIWETTTEKLAEGRGLHNFDELRWKHGLMERSRIDAEVRDAFDRRIQQHKASPITDPFRQMIYPRYAGKTVHKTPDSQDWKAN